MEFKIGDVVTLKSGGLYMTVSCLNNGGDDPDLTESVDVVYFDNDAVFRTEAMIPCECLELSKKDEG